MPIFRNERRLVYFIHIPKTGGSSIENAMRAHGVRVAMLMSKEKNTALKFSKCTPQHIHADIIDRFFGDSFFDWQFALVRNPFARIASEYKMKAALEKKPVSPDEWILRAIERYAEFPFTRDNHIRPQCQFITKEAEVFRLEDGLLKPIEKLCEVLQVLKISTVPHSRKSKSQVLKISPQTLQSIVGFYKEDFEIFGYSTSSYGDHFHVKDKPSWNFGSFFSSGN